MDTSSDKSAYGQIVGAILGFAVGGTKIAAALTLWTASLFMLHPSYAEQPYAFFGVVAFWALVLAASCGAAVSGVTSLMARRKATS